MSDNKTLKMLRRCNTGICFFFLLWIALSEAEILPTEYIPSDPETDYMLNVVSILTALGGTFLSLRLFAFGKVRKSILQPDPLAAFKAYTKWATVRILIIASAIMTNTVLYYASSHAESSKYCLLIALVGIFFCWPSAGEYEKLHTDEK